MTQSLWPYVGVLLASAIEGEVVFLAAAVLVGAGRLDVFGVWCAGSAGAALGDQLCFYAARTNLAAWLHRVPALARRQPAMIGASRRYGPLVAFGLRFAPGLRVALAAACAYGGVSAACFTLFNLLGAVVWAGSLLALVVWLGPGVADVANVSGAWGVVLVATGLIAAVRLARRAVINRHRV